MGVEQVPATWKGNHAMLNTRAIRNGAFLLSVGTGLSAAIKFFSVPLLARLLTPAEYGIAGTALVLVSFAALLGGGSGLGTAVTYFKARRETYDNAAMGTAAIVGVLLASLCWVFSAEIAGFWGAPEAAPLVRTVSVFFPLSVLTGIGYAFLARDLRFRSIAIVQVVASILSTSISIAMAFFGYGAWSLIAQFAVFDTLKFLGFFYFSDYRPRLNIQWSAIRGILPFAYRMTFSDLLIWMSREGPFILISRQIGVEFGGTFRIYQRFTGLPREIIAENVSRAVYAGMAGSSLSEARQGFLWSTRSLLYIMGAVFCWMAALGEPLTRIVLGPNFASYWILTVSLSIGLVGYTIGSMVVPFLKARGEITNIVYFSIVRTGLILTGTIIGLQLSQTIEDGAWGLSLAMFLAGLLSLAFMVVRGDLMVRDLMTSILKPLCLISATGGCVYGVCQWLFSDQLPLVILAAGTGLGLVIYILLITIFAPTELTTLKKFISKKTG